MFSRLFSPKRRDAVTFQVFAAAEDLKPPSLVAPIAAPKRSPKAACCKSVSFDVPADLEVELNKLKGKDDQELILREMVEEIYFQSLAKEGLVRTRMEGETPSPFLKLMELLTGEDRKLAKEILIGVVTEDIMQIMAIDIFLREKREALLAA
jgi:hypothetical protein